jgi:hypothetical protein
VEGYDRQGKENAAVDALSRIPHLFNIESYSEVKPLWIQEVVNSYATDLDAQELIAQWLWQAPMNKGFSFTRGSSEKDHRYGLVTIHL